MRRGSTPGNAHDTARSDDRFTPRQFARFGVVVETIEREGSAAGFRRARNLMFEHFEALAKSIQPYAILKLAIEFDRHAMMCDVRAAKADEERKLQDWQEFQRYLMGETQVAFEGQGALETPHATVDVEDEHTRVQIVDDTHLPRPDLEDEALKDMTHEDDSA